MTTIWGSDYVGIGTRASAPDALADIGQIWPDSATGLPMYTLPSGDGGASYQIALTSSASSFISVDVTGTAGAGYYGTVAQSANPSAPAAAGLRAFAGAAGEFSWVVKNGGDTYVRAIAGTLSADRTFTLPNYSMTFASIAGIETLINKTLTQPVIGDYTAATHSHLNAAGGGTLDVAAIASGQLALARGGTHSDLSATGGSNQFLKQTSAGGDVTVAAILSADLTSALTAPPAIGGVTPAAGAFTTLSSSGLATLATLNVASSAFTVASTGLTAITATASGTVLALDAATSAAATILSIYNSAAFGTSNAAQIDFRLNTSTSNRAAFRITGTFSDTTDATRTSTTNWFVSDAGTFTSALQFVGKTASFFGAATYTLTDTASSAVSNVLTLSHIVSGAGAAGLGVGIALQGRSSTTSNTAQGDIQTSWATATHASRKGRMTLFVYDTAVRTGIIIEASGTAPMIGFLGAAAAVAQTSGANLTNNVTSGGTDDTIANFTDLTTYANDAATIRNDIYQLARKLKQLNDGLRTFGLFT